MQLIEIMQDEELLLVTTKLTHEHFRSIIFYNFKVDYLDKSALMNLNLYLAIKNHPLALCKTDLMNTIVADAHSKPRSVKVVQKQPLCQRPFMPSVINPRLSCDLP